ncbi:uncharacterized protein SRS1_15991 [Sporisorium reilianum f. sp. reilianum]|uniref:Uncharacterized protein n=1 Tax=Sporisorium reilianum f. sp. reilianum TaxID=72559 RepID=A0A2N8UJV4_9BASI|nr:uncharacterized protein SRS1_15991 [Sporisorium reilianum f. sp. reilianum]
MNGQNGWYADQQPQYPPYTAQQQQQQQPQQSYQGNPQQRPRPEQQQAYMHHASTSYHSAHAMGGTQASYPDQSLDFRYAAGFNDGVGSSPASVTFPTSVNGPYNHSQPAQPAPSPRFSNVIPVRQSVGTNGGNGFVQLQGTGQRTNNSQYQQQQQHNGGQLQRPSVNFANMASPIQHRFPSSAGPSQQAFAQQSFASPSMHSTPRHQQLQPPRADPSQYAYESPYAPSTGTRERLAMSQSPVSDAFQSGGQPAGRTFNLMADFGTPTPNPPLRRTSAQTNFDSPFAAQTTQAAQPSLSNQWHSPSNNSAQPLASWPAAQREMQNAAPLSSLASWNQSKPYSDMQPSPAQSNRNPSFDR